jgi:hypothetical protein
MSEDALSAALAAQGLAVDEAVDVPEVKAPPERVEPVEKVEPRAEEADDEPELKLSAEDVEARAKGWDPDKEAYEARTGRKWVPAEVFLAKREMADEISKSHKTIKRVNKELEALKKQFDDRVKAEVGKQIADLKAERADAIREQDHERIDELDTQIDELRHPKPAEVNPDDDEVDEPEAKGPPPEVAAALADWKKNVAPWFDKAPQPLRDVASRIERGYHSANPGCSTEEALNFVAATMEKTYPELAAYGKRAQSPGAGRGGTATVTVDESKLSPQDRIIMQKMERAGMFADAKDKIAFIKEATGG